ncbi:hypothetical protein E1B28_008909 [Marasmius oreades]|uniref:Uncharacterized protein n=1 Tax=Marasmius oreades TaxID=181124 RepID=A0A9P7S002_9AGAR|nr:uncharacterized protein E1B28_008909 [Marasmius oreades]KAG7092560.1 hypothetical protein E1B28_008909 [Marasmius oreades]
MAGFLRKKSKVESSVKPKSPSARPIESTTSSPPSTPLFARYAIGQANEGDPHSDPKKLVVSSPMTLSSWRESVSTTKHNGSADQPMQYAAIGRDGNGTTRVSNSHGPEKITRISRSVSAQSPGSAHNNSSPTQTFSPRTSNIEKPLPQILPAGLASQHSPLNRLDNASPSTASPVATSPRKMLGLANLQQTKPQYSNAGTLNSPVTPHNSENAGHIPRKSSAKDLRHKHSDRLPSHNINNDFDDHNGASLAPLSPPSASGQLPQDQSTSNDITSPDDFNVWLHSQSFMDAQTLPDSQGISSPSFPGKPLPRTAAGGESVNSSQPASFLPMRGKPLIFSAMAPVNAEPPSPPMKPIINTFGPNHLDASTSYPSPPSEYNASIQTHRSPQQSHAQSSFPQNLHKGHENDFPRRQSLLSSRSRPPATFNPLENPPQRTMHKTQSQVSSQSPRKTSLTGRPPEAPSPRTLTKPRPTTPTKRPTTPKHRPLTPVSPDGAKRKAEASPDRNNKGMFSDPLIDDDPFAKTQGVKMLEPSLTPRLDDAVVPESILQSMSPSMPSNSSRDALIQHNDSISFKDASQLTRPSTGQSSTGKAQENKDGTEEEAVNNETTRTMTPPPSSGILHDGTPPSPASAERYRSARTKRRGDHLPREVPIEVKNLPVREDRPAEPFPLPLFLTDPALLSSLLSYLCFYEWCTLLSLSKGIRSTLLETPQLKETVLERYLDTVGYSRWVWPDAEPLTLSIGDLHNYMRGVSLPTHEYARVSELVLKFRSGQSPQTDETVLENEQDLVQCTRAYNRVLLRLRAQAEKELSSPSQMSPSSFRDSVRSPKMYAASQPSSRAPSPTRSSLSHSHGNTPNPPPLTTVSVPSSAGRSPLFKLRRAPLLRVFVTSPEGDWLSDNSVLECEAELDRAGIRDLIRFGDVVWDIAVGDEGNVGRMIWDGRYLLDLDYTYSAVGDLPKYLPALAFPPSYFHRVIRTGPSTSNPVVRMDLSPWGTEIAANLQLLQDRVRTETPQGAYHNVVRWVHRSSFVIRPPVGGGASHSHGKRSASRSRPTRIPIPDTKHLFVDPGWYGTIVVETEGTNESLADLQHRCGPGAFPPRAAGTASSSTASGKEREKDAKMVYRILRERSRPGEIWVRAASAKERLM